MLRIAATGDWHLGPGRQKLDAPTGLNAALLDRARVGKWVIEDAIERGAQIIVHAGDLFHGCAPRPTEVRLAKDALAPAFEAAVPVVMLCGNHDSPRNGSELHALDLLRDMDGLHIVDRPCLLDVCEHGEGHVVCRTLSEEHYGASVALQIAALPWPQTSRLLADAEVRSLDPAARNLLVREKLVDVLRGLAAQRLPDVPCLLLAHAGIDTATMGTTNTLAMISGEWTLNVHEVAALGFDVVFLGHYHKPQDLGHDIVYVGSPEAVGAGEEGEEKRYLLWESHNWESIPTPYRRFMTLTLDGSGTPAVIDESLRDCIVRLRIAEASAEYVNLPELRRHIEEDLGAYDLSVEIIRPEIQRRRETSISGGTPPAEALTQYVAQHEDLGPMEEEMQMELAGVEEERGGAG